VKDVVDKRVKSLGHGPGKFEIRLDLGLLALPVPSVKSQTMKKEERHKNNDEEEENSLPDPHFTPEAEWIAHHRPLETGKPDR
jgi:hypothetical protein